MEPFRVTVSVLHPQGLGVSQAGFITSIISVLGMGLETGSCVTVTLSLWSQPWLDWLPGALGCNRGTWLL